MHVMDSITDKPEWEKRYLSYCTLKLCFSPPFNMEYFMLTYLILQVFDHNITSKWRQEIAESGQDVTPSMMELGN